MTIEVGQVYEWETRGFKPLGCFIVTYVNKSFVQYTYFKSGTKAMENLETFSQTVVRRIDVENTHRVKKALGL